MSKSNNLSLESATQIDNAIAESYTSRKENSMAKFYSPRFDMYVTRDEFALLEKTENEESRGTEPVCSAALCQHEHTNEIRHYAIVDSNNNQPSDLKAITYACKSDADARAFIEAHADLWDDIVERKPMINKQGMFSRTHKGTIRTTTVKRHYSPTVVYMPIKSEEQPFVQYARMGSLKDAKVTRWANKVIARIKDGTITDGSWLYNHTTQTMAKAPYGLRGRTRDLISQIWFTWKQRKATIVVVNALRSLGK